MEKPHVKDANPYKKEFRVTVSNNHDGKGKAYPCK